MRKRSVKNKKNYDENIISALKALPVPLKTFDNHEVIFEENKRNESIFQHIGKQKHKLKTADIKAIPQIVNNRNSIKNDNKKKIFRNYLGERPKKNAKLKYIKIVTKKVKPNVEIVVTIYLKIKMLKKIRRINKI